MTPNEQIAAFANELQNVVQRFIREYDLNLADAIGTLELVKLELWDAQRNLLMMGKPPPDDNDDDDDAPEWQHG